MLVKVSKNMEKAKALQNMAEKHLERIGITKKASEDFSSLNLVDYYEIIKNLLIALLLLKGFKVKGEGSHAELISSVSQKYPKITEAETMLMEQLRKYRNRISYEGFSIDSSYLERTEARIEKTIEKLLKVLENEVDE